MRRSMANPRERWAWFAALLLSSGAQAAGEVQAASPQGEVAPVDEADGARLADERNSAVVTASGREESRALASANVYSVGWDEIAQRGYRSLAEILADVPGLYVVDDLVMPSVGVRGVTGGLRAGTRLVKVMINGVPVSFRPELSAFLGPEYLPVQMIERVEVAKGPLSALYGANAFIATVNVVTRGPGAGVPVIAEASARAHLAQGSPGYGGTVVGGYDEGRRSLMVAVASDRLDRSGLAITKTFPDQDPKLARYRPYFGETSRGDLAHPTSIYSQLRADVGAAGTLTAQGGLQRLDSMGEFQLNSVLTHRSRVALENDWLSLRHDKQWSQGLGSAVWVGWSRGAPVAEEELYLTGSRDVAFSRRFRYQALDAAAELTAAPFWHLTLKGGADFSHEQQTVLHYSELFLAPQGTNRSGDRLELIGAGDTRDVALRNGGAYLQLVERPLEGLLVVLDGRVDLPSHYPAQYSWRAAVGYRFSDSVAVRVVGGRAYQTPSAVLLYGLPGFGSANNVIGNRTRAGALPLLPQVVHSVEAVTSLQLLGRLAIEASLYGQQVDDRIEFAQAGPHFQAKNQGQQRNVGAELSSRLVYDRISVQLAGSLQRTLLEGQLVEEPPPLYPNAMLLARFNLMAPEVRLNLNGQLKWVGDRGASQSNVALNNDEPYVLPGYATMDLTLSTLGLNFLGGAQTTLAVGVRNVFDLRWSEPGFGGFDVPNQGRSFVAELRQAF